jgi:hypothetical protein
MSKQRPTGSNRTKAASAGWPLVVYVWAGLIGLVSYVAAEIALGATQHPWHWGITLAGIAAGILIGWLWYRWRGDIA